MNRKLLAVICLSAALSILLVGCSATAKEANLKDIEAAEAPPPAQVIPAGNSSLVTVDKPEQFAVVAAGTYDAAPQLNVTGAVSPDVSRNMPVISIATGRVLEIRAKLGDTVNKGELLIRVQSADISGAFSDYRQALADQTLARAQLDRAKLLLEKGAIAQKDYEVAVDTAAKADVTVETTVEHLRVLGADKDHPDVDRRRGMPRFPASSRTSRLPRHRACRALAPAQSVYDLGSVPRLDPVRRL